MKNEKSKRLKTRKFIFAWLFICGLAIGAAAQPETFRVGETVETNDGRVCKILTVTGRSAKVACGANRSDIRIYGFDSLTSEASAAARREQEERQRQNAANQPRPTSVAFNQGDTVNTPDGRTGKIESFKTDEMAKVQFAPNETQYFMVKDLKKIEPPKPINNEPVENFRVGDTVVDRSDPNRQLKIDSISGDSAVVRYGIGRYNVRTEKLENLMSLKTRDRKQTEENEGKLIRAQFEDEAKPFMNTIQLIAPSFNPKIIQQGGSFNPTPATYEAWRKDLASLAAICQKYPNVTNTPFADDPVYSHSVAYRHADWCEMARQRDTLIKGFLKDVGSDQTKYAVNSVQILLNEAERDSDGYIGDELQTVLFDRAAWMRKKDLQQYKTQYGLTDAEIETKVFTPLAGKLGELKSKIESDGSNLAATLPKISDAALEGVVKRRIAADYPGGQVLKIGLDSANWSVRDGKENIGSNSNGTQYYLRIKGAYRIRTGRALVRLPNQPFCQIRSIELIQGKKGAGFEAAWARVETRGKFVKCP